MKYQCWEDDLGLTFSTADGCQQDGAMDKNSAKLLYEFEAGTWEEAMAEHHKRQGWEPYIPPEI